MSHSNRSPLKVSTLFTVALVACVIFGMVMQARTDETKPAKTKAPMKERVFELALTLLIPVAWTR